MERPSKPRESRDRDDDDDDHGDDTQLTVAPAPPSNPPDSLGDITKSELIIGPDVGSFQLTPGAMLGEYRIEGIAGEGGMGVVYAAVHPMIGKRAAIKVLKKEMCEDPHNVERFIDEARVVNQIGHPNIIDIFAFGEMPNGRSYFVMEWLKGESLRDRLAKPPRLSLVAVCAILKPLARALMAAHDKGIIHRDLKPDNIFLGEPDDDDAIPVKLLDFGIAKLARTEPRLERTATGTMVGTPMYIAPEQARGYAIDHRADIYSLGAIAFEMLTGRTPFLADNAMEMVAKHLLEPPPTVGSVAPNTPKALDSIVSAMLQKDATARPTLAALLSVLDGVKTAETTSPSMRSPLTSTQPVVARPRGRRWIAVGAVVVGVAAVAFVVTYVARGSSEVAAGRDAAAIAAIDATASAVAPDAAPEVVAIALPDAAPPRDAPELVADAPKPKHVVPTPPPPTPPAPTKGRVVVTLRGVASADYFIDGKHVGSGRTLDVQVAFGDHELEVRSGKSVERSRLEVTKQTAPRVVTLKPDVQVPDTGLMAPGSLDHKTP